MQGKDNVLMKAAKAHNTQQSGNSAIKLSHAVCILPQAHSTLRFSSSPPHPHSKLLEFRILPLLLAAARRATQQTLHNKKNGDIYK
jgi:hypothetical protein